MQSERDFGAGMMIMVLKLIYLSDAFSISFQ